MELYQVGVAMGFHVMDLVVGFVGGLKEHDVQSSKLRDGMFKKVGFLFCYLIAFTIDHFGELIGFQVAVPILPVIVLYGVTTELVSIIENIHRINPNLLPETLMGMFHVKQEKEENKDVEHR